MDLEGMGGGGGGAPTQAPIRATLGCTLEELCTGTTKKIKVTRKRGGVDSEKLLEIVIKPGWKKGTSITFEHEGDEVKGGKPANLVFVIEEKPHARFQRDGSDLVMDLRLRLVDALCGTKVDIQTLDGRTLSVAVPEVITPGYLKRVKGEGMPGKGGVKGDIVLRFEVTFPSFIPDAKKAALKSLL
jgi:DnaJ family protein B protein 4